MLNTLVALLLIVTAFLVALAALIAFGLVDKRRSSRLRQFSESERDAVVFIFEDETLLDATPAARRFLESSTHRGTSWTHLAALVSPRFPKFNERMHDLAEFGELVLTSTDATARIKAEWHDGVARITIENTEPGDHGRELDSQSLAAMTQELESLRTNADHTPYPLWRMAHGGVITWCNAAYLDLADSLRGSDDLPSWPPATVFELSDDAHDQGGQTPSPQRVAICPPGQNTRHWFEVTTAELENGDRFHAAVPVDRLVRAETALDEFVTTLTKTFASLPIGLAIFDRSRELALFNPALMDLTVLPAEFLISKPSLSAFLDKLREARIMPEPKDYRSWRHQMSDLVAAAQNGTYEETWALPTGQTYRVTGRPHPDGAVALLFEDISAEISVTRRFRAELETGQAALDALPQAVAVFSAGGVLAISNAAYADLWGNDPSTSLDDITILDTVKRWQMKTAPNAIWDQVRRFVSQSGPRERWHAHVPMTNGQMLECRVQPLARGATMISFVLPQTQLTPRQDAGEVPDRWTEPTTIEA
ncbi:PAS-domain containing protein [Sinisalibacter lacisalsi]|uniref:Diguanylate cyclase n=1 Tax=Sinisalibacter lacisalsi TaxID=1526570 RepID=A0ABQ1QBG2_9RHOB|nr:PAS-domain containing protein [Sinisalibacter lacisalsi]GGD21242.1 diguanylate cyclase [Sinisalibacter lacisalsi]